MPKRIWEKAESIFLSDTAGLIALASIALVRGFSYLPMNVDVRRAPAHFLEGLLPPPAWAAVWLIIGALCVIATRFPQAMPLAVGLAVGLNVVWFASFAGIQFFGDNSRAYVTAINYFGVGFFVAWGFGRGRKIISFINKG